MRDCQDCKWFEHGVEKARECGVLGHARMDAQRMRVYGWCGKEAKLFEPKGPGFFKRLWLTLRREPKAEIKLTEPDFTKYEPNSWR